MEVDTVGSRLAESSGVRARREVVYRRAVSAVSHGPTRGYAVQVTDREAISTGRRITRNTRGRKTSTGSVFGRQIYLYSTLPFLKYEYNERFTNSLTCGRRSGR